MIAAAGTEIIKNVNISEIKDSVSSNISVKDILGGLPPDLALSFGTLITILKAIGIVFLIYLVFLIVRSILGIIEKRRIKEIHKKVNEIDEKVDMLLEKAKGKNEKKDRNGK